MSYEKSTRASESQFGSRDSRPSHLVHEATSASVGGLSDHRRVKDRRLSQYSNDYRRGPSASHIFSSRSSDSRHRNDSRRDDFRKEFRRDDFRKEFRRDADRSQEPRRDVREARRSSVVERQKRDREYAQDSRRKSSSPITSDSPQKSDRPSVPDRERWYVYSVLEKNDPTVCDESKEGKECKEGALFVIRRECHDYGSEIVGVENRGAILSETQAFFKNRGAILSETQAFFEKRLCYDCMKVMDGRVGYRVRTKRR